MVLQTLIGPVTGLLDKFIEDKDQKNALAHEIATLVKASPRGSPRASRGQQARSAAQVNICCWMAVVYRMGHCARACIPLYCCSPYSFRNSGRWCRDS